MAQDKIVINVSESEVQRERAELITRSPSDWMHIHNEDDGYHFDNLSPQFNVEDETLDFLRNQGAVSMSVVVDGREYDDLRTGLEAGRRWEGVPIIKLRLHTHEGDQVYRMIHTHPETSSACYRRVD